MKCVRGVGCGRRRWRRAGAAALAVAGVAAAGQVSAQAVRGGSGGGLRYDAEAFYYSTLATTPATQQGSYYNELHRPVYGGFYSGVARLSLTQVGGGIDSCTGALLASGKHVLTAAHCVTDFNGDRNVTGGEAAFPTRTTGAYTGRLIEAGIKRVKVHEAFDGDYVHTGHDLAVLTLDRVVPRSANRYALYTGTDEIGKTTVKVGWGTVGTGNGRALDTGLRKGLNTYDATASVMLGSLGGGPLDSVLQYDFDNGKARNDAFGYFFGIANLGLGLPEVTAARGDSGGPTFIDGMIAGVTSYGITLRDDQGKSSDVTVGRVDSSFGEFGGDTRVSSYVGWIQAAMVPEPGTWALALAGLGVVALAARRRRAAAPAA